MYYSCPVCGYSQMSKPPENHYICPSCGTEFGYDDFTKSHRQLRNEWLLEGANWFSCSTLPPDSYFWNGFRQVIEADLPYDVPVPITATFQKSEATVPSIGEDENIVVV